VWISPDQLAGQAAQAAQTAQAGPPEPGSH